MIMCMRLTNMQDMFYLEDPSDRPFSEQPFSVSFPMDSKQLFVNFGRVEADNVFPKVCVCVCVCTYIHIYV